MRETSAGGTKSVTNESEGEQVRAAEAIAGSNQVPQTDGIAEMNATGCTIACNYNSGETTLPVVNWHSRIGAE